MTDSGRERGEEGCGGIEGEILCVRHGKTFGDRRDDPLTPVGEEQALECGKAWREWSGEGKEPLLVLVSPLTRAIQTCVRILRGAGIDVEGKEDGLVRIVALPLLREFRLDQKEDGELGKRHIGTKLSEIRPMFPFVEFPFDEEEWWTPHGGFSRGGGALQRIISFTEQFDSIRRSFSSLHKSDGGGEGRGGEGRGGEEGVVKKVMVVAHENVLRAMLGVAGMWNAEGILVKYPFPKPSSLHPPVMHPSRLHDHVASACALGRRPKCVCLLGCSSSKVWEERWNVGVAKALLDDRSLLVVVCGVREFYAVANCWNRLTVASRESLRGRCLIDHYSTTTECNLKLLNAHLQLLHDGPWDIDLVTSNWHIPRAILCHYSTLVSTPLAPLHILSYHGVPTHLPHLFARPDWLGYTRIIVAQVQHMGKSGRVAGVWTEVCEAAPQCVKALSELCAIGLEAGIFRPASSEDFDPNELRALVVARSPNTTLLRRTLSDALSAGVLLSRLPIGPHGSHMAHYAAEVGNLHLLRDLVHFFGADVEATNSKGYNVMHYAQKLPESPEKRAIITFLENHASDSH